MDKKLQDNLRREAKHLLDQGQVGCVIGFEPGTVRFATTPVVLTAKDNVGRLVVNDFISNNLAKMLLKLPGKAAIVAKGCDSRSIVSLIQDHKIARENVVIIGVPCEGLVDLNKVERSTGWERDEIDQITRRGAKFTVNSGQDEKEVPLPDVLYDCCLTCQTPTPQECDIRLGEPAAPPSDKAAARAQIAELEQMTPPQRWQFWREQMQQCTRCYACRQVCPVCYCERCFVEETEPKWVEGVPQWQDNLTFQITRTLHVAGRCTDCGACQRACPVGIPLNAMTRKMCDIVDELFDYQAGTDIKGPPLMASYEQDEAEGLIK